MLQAAARAGAARAQLHEARSSLAAAEAALHARIAHVERQADAGLRPGAWFVQSHGHLDALRAALRVRRESVHALHAQAAQAAAVLATHRRLLAVSSARREQAESLLTRLQRRHRAAIVARHDAAQTELLPSSTRHRRFPLSPVPFRS